MKKCKIEEKSKTRILTVLRLWLAQLEDRDLALRLDLLMDHNEDRRIQNEYLTEKDEDQEIIEILCDIVGIEDHRSDFHRLLGGS